VSELYINQNALCNDKNWVFFTSSCRMVPTNQRAKLRVETRAKAQIYVSQSV